MIHIISHIVDEANVNFSSTKYENTNSSKSHNIKKGSTFFIFLLFKIIHKKIYLLSLTCPINPTKS